MNNSLSAVIWDIDGVLIDSEPLHFEALCHVSAKYGWHISEQENQAMLGLGLPDVYKELQIKHPVNIQCDNWMNEITQFYLENVHSGMIRSGIQETIKMLYENNVAMMAVSSAERVIVDANLASIGLTQFLSGSIAREDVINTKPAPDPYLKAIKQLELSSESIILAVEDTLFGLQSARDSGLTTIAFAHAMSACMPKDASDHFVKNILKFEWCDALGLKKRSRIEEAST